MKGVEMDDCMNCGDPIDRESLHICGLSKPFKPSDASYDPAAAERAKVVAWLRAGGVYDRPGPATIAANYRLAAAIEALAHHEGDAP